MASAAASTGCAAAPPSGGPAAHLATATLAGGCFWCVEAPYSELRGVHSAVSGYIGGEVPNPSYKAVCSGATGHAEAVRVSYDPAQISFGALLDVFFTLHDPTTLNRQGNDVGTQYRSAIFYHGEGQAAEARAKIGELEGAGAFGGARVVTQVEDAAAHKWWPAEEYHQCVCVCVLLGGGSKCGERHVAQLTQQTTRPNFSPGATSRQTRSKGTCRP